MFTIFHFVQLVGSVIGAYVGGRYGSSFGAVAMVFCAVIGWIVGAFVGNLPWAVAWAWMRYDLKRTGVEKLKERLQREFFIAHILIGELVSRGEPLEQFREHVVRLLHSSTLAERQFGQRAASVWFPDLLTNQTQPTDGSRVGQIAQSE